MIRSAWLFGMLGVTAIAGALSAQAQEKQKQAAIDLSQVDDDYALQGEYLGHAKIAENGRWRHGHVGLQVVALGDGEFDAVLYTGGLPGAGWNGRDRLQLAGEREGNRLRLADGPLRIDVDGRSADISYPGYSARSRIEKILRVSPTAGSRPPRQAVVLFDGTGTGMLKNGRVTDNGLLMEGADTRDAYKDFTLHLEFRLPYMPHARGQGRANSGVYIQSRYEVQILDSFGLEGKDNECGGLYRQRPPDLNMCYPPLRWQTFDLDFTSPNFDESGNKIANARLTARHNGVLIHDDVELTDKTGGGRPEGPETLPTRLQDHGNPIRFRNIWLVEDVSPGDRRPLLQLAGRRGGAGETWRGGGTGRFQADGSRLPTSPSPSLALSRPAGATYATDYPPPYPDARPMPNLRYYGHYRVYPRPLHQYRQMEYNPSFGGYAPIDYYSPVPPDRHGYWTW